MTEAELEDVLAASTPEAVADLARVAGDILIVGVAGKMGPSLARLAVHASREAGVRRRVIGVSRFSNPGVRESLDQSGVETIACDLFDRAAVDRLPDAPNVIYMVGQKFGTSGEEARTWAVNAWLPGELARRFPRARIVAFSTGNVYPLSPVSGPGPSETDPTGPIGEYARSVLARERLLQFFSAQNGTPMAILRLNYAIEPRYGVLRDIADAVKAGMPIDLRMGHVNVIWQRDANAIALRALAQCAAPPLLLNVTGRPAVSVRWLAERFGERFDIAPRFEGVEAPTALLSNAAQCEELFGPAPIGIETMIHQVANWVTTGGCSLGRPTHFEERAGKF